MSSLELQRLLGCLPPPFLDEAELAALARGWPAALDGTGLAAHARFSDREYTRIRIHRAPGWELLVVGWLPGQRTGAHGHGESHGLTCVLEGTLVEVEYGLGPGGQVRKLARRKHPAGGVFRERPETIHTVEHAGHARAISLHLYAPPLDRMEVYGSTGTSQPRGSGRRAPKSSVSAR